MHRPVRNFSKFRFNLILYSRQVTMQISGKIYYCTVAVIQIVVYNNQLKLNEVYA